MKQSMTRDEFIAYAHEVTSGEAMEPLYERLAEHASEVAMFGDSGPGTAYYLHQSIAELYSIERQLARLENREPRRFPGLAVRSPN